MARAEAGADEPVAEHRGVNVHAEQWVDGRDRRQLERLCRYVTRPPVAQDRLERLSDGRLALDEHADTQPPRRKRWAWLLKHVFAADLDTCPRCSGPMRWLAAAASKDAARDLLARLGLAPRPPPIAHPPPLGQLELPLVR